MTKQLLAVAISSSLWYNYFIEVMYFDLTV